MNIIDRALSQLLSATLIIAVSFALIPRAEGQTTNARTDSTRVVLSSTARVTLGDLGFISGLWQAEWAGGLGEEHWSTASGDSMVGTFRFVKDGKARFYEFMLIEQTADGPVLRLKHFNRGLIGWEEKAQVYSYPLTEYRQTVAVFERGDKKSRLTFHRTSKETLSVSLEQTTDEKRSSEEFKFRLAK